MFLPHFNCTFVTINSPYILEDNKEEWYWVPRTDVCYFAMNADDTVLKSSRLIIMEHLMIKWHTRDWLIIINIERPVHRYQPPSYLHNQLPAE